MSDLSLPGVLAEPSIPVAQIRAAVALLSPDEMTPTAKRMLLSICDQHDQADTTPRHPLGRCGDPNCGGDQ